MSRNSPQEEFESKLAQELIDHGLISKAELDEALENQVLTGGHLATNLWELGLCDLSELTRHSAHVLDIKAVPPKAAATVSKKILRAFPRPFVERHRVLPLRVKNRQLSVAICDPWDLAALDEAGRLSRLRVKPFYLAEVPLVKLMERHYRIPASARFQLTPKKRVRPKAEKTLDEDAVGEDLISDEEFSAIYGAGDGAFTNTFDDSPTDGQGEPDVISTPPDPEPAMQPSRPEQPAPLIEEEIIEDAEIYDDAELIEDEEDIEGEILELAEIIEEAQAEEERNETVLEPIATLADANALLDAAEDRDALGQILVRFALSKGKRAVLLTSQRDTWLGWTGAGEGVTSSKVRSLMLPSESGTCFGLVNMTQAHFLGPMMSHPVHDRFLEVLGEQKPVTVGLFPVHFRGRVVFGLYMDAGDGAYMSPDIADILIFALRVPAAIERLLQEKQAA